MINNKHLCEIFEPTLNIDGWTDQQIKEYSIERLMYPTSVYLTSETYSRNASRTADYELKYLTLVNRKARPEFTWSLLKNEYLNALMSFLEYDYDFKDQSGIVIPRPANDIIITYPDFVGVRTIEAYLGQTITGELFEYEHVVGDQVVTDLYWRNLRIAFPER